jgi:hypothetical protein
MDQRCDVQELSERVCRVERQNRRRWLALLGVVGLGGALLIGAAEAAPKPSVVEANGFVLKHSSGEIRGELMIGPDGGGLLVLYGPDGRPVSRLPLQTQMFPARP